MPNSTKDLTSSGARFESAIPSRAEAMTAPRLRERHHPPSPPDRLPPRRGGRPSPETASAAGRQVRLGGTRRAAVGLHASRRGGVPVRLTRSTAAVLAVMAAVLLVSGEARAQTETEHWSATLTRASGVGGSSGNYGYVAATETGPGGMLEPLDLHLRPRASSTPSNGCMSTAQLSPTLCSSKPPPPCPTTRVWCCACPPSRPTTSLGPARWSWNTRTSRSTLPIRAIRGLFSWPVSFTSCLTSGPSRHNLWIDGLESNDVILLHGELLFRGEFPAALTFINGTALARIGPPI